MSKFSEQTFNHWKRAASTSEEQRISNVISMIKNAIRSSVKLQNLNIDFFVQGSYANNTNVRSESDVDICVMLKDTFYTKHAKNLTDADYGFTEGTNNYSTFRSDVLSSLISKFGSNDVKQGNKSIKINSNSYRVDADVVPSFQYRNYWYSDSHNPNKFEEGVKFYSLNDIEVINYPKIHLVNGRLKNTETQRRYKRLTRIIKRIKYQMIVDGISVNNGISSFLIECLVWNTPNFILNSYSTWTERLKQTIIYLYNQTKKSETCEEWGEVSEILYLFKGNRKWNVEMVNNFLKQIWNYLKF